MTASLQSALAKIQSVRQSLTWNDPRRDDLMAAEGVLIDLWRGMVAPRLARRTGYYDDGAGRFFLFDHEERRERDECPIVDELKSAHQ